MKTYTLDELTDKYIGKIGTPERDKFEQDLKEELEAYHIGEAIRQARLSKNLTQEELGERMGVQKAQVSRLERGKSMSKKTIIVVIIAIICLITVPIIVVFSIKHFKEIQEQKKHEKLLQETKQEVIPINLM